MGKYFDSGYDFLMTRVTLDAEGAEVKGEETEIESAFPGLVYKSMSGLDMFGKPRPYVETYAEEDAASVYVDANDARKQTELTLTLYFFDPDDNEEESDAIEAVEKVYRDFMAFVSGCTVIWRDTGRRRKVKMYLSSSTSPKTDRLYGQVYKEAEFKFTNVYGRSFDYEDTTF